MNRARPSNNKSGKKSKNNKPEYGKNNNVERESSNNFDSRFGSNSASLAENKINTTNKHDNDRLNRLALWLMQAMVWGTFAVTMSVILFYFPEIPSYKVGSLLTINGFTLLMWAAISLFSGIVYSYSTRYMQGFRRYYRFMSLILAITLSVMLFVSANHIALLVAGWVTMGISMAHMIGIVPGWAEAKKALSISRGYFMSSSALLLASLILLSAKTGHYTVSGILDNLEMLSSRTATVAALGLILAGVIQASLFPFHRWLLSAMTAPTPSSALMHAGFVNAAGILLARFAPLIFFTETLIYLFLIGAVGALMAQFWKLVQTTVKQRLACSTIAQMGFMLLQCGLGFFSAAVTHLILHGFYKAYLFLSSGSGIERRSPSFPKDSAKISTLVYVPVIAGAGLMAGLLFAWLTGKGTGWDSGLFLTFIVVFTVFHAARQTIQQKKLTAWHKLLVMPLMIVLATGIYAAIFNGITLLMLDLPFSNAPVSITIWHLGIAVIYLIMHIIMETGWYKKIPQLYVILLNMSQPNKKTILAYKKSTL